MFRTSSIDDLLDLLEPPEIAASVAGSAPEPGASLILLPTARAARELRSAFDARQQSLGRPGWEPAAALSWTQWTRNLWSELVIAGAEPRLLLNSAQEHTLWREIIAAEPAAGGLASPDSLADLARSAWQLAAAYNATRRLRGAATSHDSRLFADWAAAFTRLCATRNYLSAALLDDALRQHLESRDRASAGVPPPNALHLAGYDHLTPTQESLLAAFRERGTEIVHHRLQVQPANSSFHASTVAATERDELFLAARWIRNFLEHLPTHVEDRCARVAVLLPHLNEDRAELEAVFRETLAPELQSVAADLSSTPWEIGGGPPLSSLAMIAAALDLARWTAAPLPLERVSSLLLSPYLGDPGAQYPAASAHREAVAQFDARVLRRTPLLRPELGPSTLVSLLESPRARALSPHRQPLLLWPRNLLTFLERSGDLARPRTFADWTEFLRELLRTVNWPAPDLQGPDTTVRALTATESAAVVAWDSSLDLLATLDFSGRRVPFSLALEALERQTQTTAFDRPRTDAAVQVMTLADSAGCIFDATIFLHATDTHLPSPERANPLLPWSLQSALGMPGTSAAHTAARARAFTAGLLARSGTVLFTSAAEDADGHLRPSPLLAELNLTAVDPAELVPTAPAPTPIAMETVSDDAPLPAPPSSAVYGGARVLKLQAACGFRAFAELRLHATEPDRADLGLDAIETGTILHSALQSFWSEVKTQKALRLMPPHERTVLLGRCIDHALPRGLRPDGPWDGAYLALQKERHLSILQHWLEEELKRGPFTVLALEDEQQITVGPLTLSVRMDRIDQVGQPGEGQPADHESGSQASAEQPRGVFFVDYKTGATAQPSQWEGPRPDDPQLPLYALLAEPGELKGLAFARIRAGRDMRWLGLQSEPGVLPDPRAKVVDLAVLVAEWRASLGQLAEDFAAGCAAVSPKRYPQTCTHCAQRLLCRLDPVNLLDEFSDGNLTDHGAEHASRSEAIAAEEARRRSDG